MAPTSIDGNDITGATIDGQDVSEITVDGQTVFTAIPDSLVSRFKFEQNVLDSQGTLTATDNTGTGYSNTSAVGDFSKNFDTGGTLPISTSSLSLNSYTISFHFLFRNIPTGFNGNYLFDSTSDPERYYIVKSAKDAFTSSWGTGPSTLQLNENELYMLTLVNNSVGGDVEWYLDGSLDTTGAGEGIDFSSNDIELGGEKFPQNYLNGLIDDFRIYDKALSSTEISNLFNTGSING